MASTPRAQSKNRLYVLSPLPASAMLCDLGWISSLSEPGASWSLEGAQPGSLRFWDFTSCGEQMAGGRSAAPSSAPELSLSTASVASRHRAGTEENFGGVYGTDEGAGPGAGPSQRELAGHRAGESGDGWGQHQLCLSLSTACVICSCVQHLRASSSPVAWEEQVPSASGAARGM